MPSQKKRPGKYGTEAAVAEAPKTKNERAYESSLKESCARWLWEAERKRPHSLHAVPVAFMEGARLLSDARHVELVDVGGSICRLTPTFRPWWTRIVKENSV